MLPPLKDGTILRERYRLTKIVGQGGMGSVYRAEDLRLPGRLCAIKEVQPEPGTSPELAAQMQTQFLQEASILAQLDHPNLPKVSDFFAENGREYLVMDYVPGKDLKRLLDESRAEAHNLNQNLVLTWADQILDAVEYLHNQSPPVLHRDIKPANIKLTPDNRIKLVDFGLVKLMAPDDNRTITVMQGRGTALYTPLEQYGGDEGHTDVRTDIYALGATFYYLLTNTPPPDAKTRFLSPRALRPLHEQEELPRRVADAVSWAMEMHPDDRPSSIAHFRRVFQGKEDRPGHPTALPEPNFFQAMRAHRLAAGLALILLVIAIILTIL